MRSLLRLFRSSPVFVIVCVVTFAIGIASSTVIFSAYQALVLKPLPYPSPDTLFVLHAENREENVAKGKFSLADFTDIAANLTSAKAMAAWNFEFVNITGIDLPTQVTLVNVTPDFFRMLGVTPALGHTWTTEESQLNASPAVILAHAVWVAQFGSDPGIIGRTIIVDDIPHRVTGVMAAGFRDVAGGGGMWRPITEPQQFADRVHRIHSVVIRNKEGANPVQLQSELNLIAKHLAASGGSTTRGWSIRSVPLAEDVMGESKKGISMLFAAVILVMLIVCLNVAGLQLMRAISRRREFAIKMALGARISELVRQLLIESLGMAGVGALIGLLFAWWGVNIVRTVLPEGWLPRSDEIRIDFIVIAYSTLAAIFAGALSGVLPALHAARSNVNLALKTGGAKGTSVGANRVRHGLIAAQMAGTLILLVAAGLMVRSCTVLFRVDPGIRTDKVLTMVLSLSPKRFPTAAKRTLYYQNVVDTVKVVPGVVRVGIMDTPPFRWSRSTSFSIEGRALAIHEASYDSVSTDLFATLGVPLVAGRRLLSSDTLTTPTVVVVNEAFVRRFFPGEDCLQRQLTFTGLGKPFKTEIVGVVGDIRRDGVQREAPPQMYFSIAQRAGWFCTLLVETVGAPASSAPTIRRAIHTLNADQAVTKIQTMDEIVDAQFFLPLYHLTLFSGFAVIAIMLASVGLYASVSLSILERSREFAIRLALGAQPRSVLTLVVRSALTVAALGTAAGLLCSLGITRLLRPMIFGVGPYDPLVYGAACGILFGVTTVAALVPAIRTLSINPVNALKAE